MMTLRKDLLGATWMLIRGIRRPYDFYDEENGGIAESSHKNGIYCITQNVMEFSNFCMDKSKIGQYT